MRFYKEGSCKISVFRLEQSTFSKIIGAPWTGGIVKLRGQQRIMYLGILKF